MTSQEKALWTLLGLAGAVGLFVYLVSDDTKKNQRSEGNLRTRTNVRTGSRDLSDNLGSKIEEKEFSPNLSTKIELTRSRSLVSEPISRPWTSNKISTPIIPLKNADIRKYPDYYYKLSKKSQWKFRKQNCNQKSA